MKLPACMAILALGAPGWTPAAGTTWPEADGVARALLASGRLPGLAHPSLSAEAPPLRALYAAEPGALFWFDGTLPRGAVAGCVETLASAQASGLDPADYDADALAGSWAAIQGGAASPAEAAAFDLALSAALMRLLGDVHQGRVDPRSVGFAFDVSAKRLDLPAELRLARDAGGCAAAVRRVQPQFVFYDRALRALAAYRAWAAQGELPRVPDLPRGKRKVEPGTPWPGATQLEARLRLLGDLPASAPPPATGPDGTPVYEGALVEAVKRFQGRHALDADGVIGPRTIVAVNTPLSSRVRQIELALERSRWVPVLTDQRVILVNVPVFMLWALERGKPTDLVRMRVVAGKSVEHQTPLFMDTMEYVIFRPFWNPPPSILREEILPRARRDPGYLAREDMEIVASGAEDAPALPATPENLDRVESGRLFLRQRPGSRNALGLVKFIFPNASNVYMHGTPARALFGRPRRDFSHGCIRLEDPTRLAEWVLRDDPRWTRARIEEAMAGEHPLRVNLPTPLTVLIFYDTVMIDADGLVLFADDYYRHDARLERALREPRRRGT